MARDGKRQLVSRAQWLWPRHRPQSSGFHWEGGLQEITLSAVIVSLGCPNLTDPIPRANFSY